MASAFLILVGLGLVLGLALIGGLVMIGIAIYNRRKDKNFPQ